jgi:hypothetical protein
MEHDYSVMVTVTELSWVLLSVPAQVKEMRLEEYMGYMGKFHHRCVRSLQHNNSQTQVWYHLRE